MQTTATSAPLRWNAFTESGEAPVDILKVTDEAERSQRDALARLRGRRDQAQVEARLAALGQAASEGHNVIPAMLDCARAYCTLHEIRDVLERVYGSYREPVFF